jgi:colicin import membrane protein
MHSIYSLILPPTLLASLLLAGCSRESRPRYEPPTENRATTENAKPAPSVSLPSEGRPLEVLPNNLDTPPATVANKPPELRVPAAPEISKQEKYDAALREALTLMGDRKLDLALAKMEVAQAYQDTEQIRLEIEKVKGLIAQRAAAERTAQDIQTVLNEGKPEEAARLATASLQQYGQTDAAEQLAKLKRQVDALTAAQIDDVAARRQRFRQEGEAALAEKNLRAAVIAFEQALQNGEDPALRQRLDETRATLTRYDDNCRRAAELRRDPTNLEDALAALQEAAQAWDTVQVRQEIDACTLALQKRRDRISVADFEVRGDVGIPFAGRTLAEELLPAFKYRFDLAERGQLSKVVDELRLQGSELAENESGRREVGRLAKLRYLVLGSITPLCGITVNARLVDVRSGLAVQTAKLVVATPEELLRQLPRLANLLMMTDEQRIAYEHQLALEAAAVGPVVIAPLPPPPEIPVTAQPLPPPIIANCSRPPDFGGLRPEDFQRLPPVGQPVLAPVVVVEREESVKQRLLQVSIELGDNLFRRRRFKEAHVHFELALRLSPERQDLRVRIDRCQPHLPPPVVVAPPPPPVVVVTPTSPPPVVVVAPPVARPRIAVFNFVVNANPTLAPPGLGDWAAEHLASYYSPTYEVVDRGEVFWYMGRLGMTVRDVATDDSARRWLGRALNVRYFVFGVVQQTASFDVSTHMVDVESGAKQGTGSIHVQDQTELKLRMNELFHQSQKDPAEQARLQQEAKESERELNEARRLLKEGQFAKAAAVCQESLKRRPNNVAMQALLQQAQQQAQQAALEEARRRELEQRKAQAEAAQRRQLELARQAEAARKRAEQEAAARGEAARKAQELQRQRAYDQLVAQARVALQQKNYQAAIHSYESAVALKPNDAGFRELAQAKAASEEAVRTQAAQEKARREAELRRQHEAEVARVQAQVEAERRRREADEQARRKAQEARDQAAYAKFLDEGQKLLAQEKYDAAIATLQNARQLRKTDESDRLLNQALEKQAKAKAQQQGAQARADLERRLAAEKAQRDKAEAEARRNRDLYAQALQAAQQALTEKRYDQAIAKYEEAGKIFRTDAVLAGIHAAQDARAKENAAREATLRQQAEAQKQAENLQKLLTQGRTALDAKQYDRAIQAFTEAKKLAPGNVEVLTGLSKAEQARVASLAQARRQAEEQQRQAAQQQTQKAEQDRLAKVAADQKKRLADYQAAMQAGGKALFADRYDDAIKAFTEAGRLMPGDPQAAKLLKDAQQAQEAQTRKKQDEQKRLTEFTRLIGQGQTAMTAKRYEEAVKAYTEALKLQPNDSGATQALRNAEQALQSSKTPPPQPAKPPVTPPAKPVTPPPATPPTKPQPSPQPSTPPQPAVKPPMPPNTPPAVPSPKPPMVNPQAEYTKQMQAGAAFEKQQKYDEAIRAYKEALRVVPGDVKAGAAVHMAEGQKALKAKRFADAAREFEETLKLIPNHPEATKALKQAKQGRP